MIALFALGGLALLLWFARAFFRYREFNADVRTMSIALVAGVAPNSMVRLAGESDSPAPLDARPPRFTA